MILKPSFTIIFYQEESGKEPVLSWIKKLDKSEQIRIGEDLQTLQYRWPLGMPLVKFIDKGIWELRSRFETRIARILFVVRDKNIILLHGFIKKTEKIPIKELDIAKSRLKKLGGYGYA